jgi:hypothetical protein
MRPILKRLGVVVLVVPAALLISCSASARDTGTLTGHLRMVGGPPPGIDRPVPGTVTISDGSTTRQQPVSDDGAYAVDLPPGNYTVVGHSPAAGDNEPACPAASVATITSHMTTTADAICSIR